MTVEIDAAAYRRDAVVTVVVQNAGSAPVYGEDRRSGCTIVTLQRQDGDRWVPVSACGVRRPPVTVPVQAGERATCRLDLALVSPDGLPVAAGVYRVVFDFDTTAGPEAGVPGTAVSATFVVDG